MTASARTRIPRIHTLEKEIRRHQNLYYTGNPEIPDEDFDRLWDELKELDPENTLFSSINSEFTDGFAKEFHLIPMGSQDKAANPEAFQQWARRVKLSEYLVQYKLDGASLELQYASGVFVRAVTRGDGRIGDDITDNARKMRGLVSILPGDWGPEGRSPFSGGIRGEVIMRHEVLSRHFPDKANCRNAANGLMKRKDGTGCEHLDILCYDAAPGVPGSPFTGQAPFQDEVGKMQWLSDCGFKTVPMTIVDSADAVVSYRAHVMDIRSTLPYDIDGLVIKGRVIDPADLQRSRPEKQIAFKFSLEEAVSVLRRVEWSESGATYTPIAHIDPVRLAGTTVQRANLANPNMIAALNLHIGSHVLVTKRGEIIPKIESLVENPPGVSPIEKPSRCGTCGFDLIDEGTRLYCPNATCPKRSHHRLEKWISTLDVRDFGIQLIERLFKSGRVRTVADLYTLTVEELADMERMGETSARKVLRSLHSRKTISLSAFVAGFDIEGIGETLIDKLVEAGYDTLDALLAASSDDFASVYQFGPILAKTLRDGLDLLREEMRALIDTGLIEILPPETGGVLAGKSFCFTGELVTMKRSEAEALVKRLGGSTRSSVVKDLSFLVTNDGASNSSKNRKARELGIPVIDEKAFIRMTSAEQGELFGEDV